MTRNQRDLALAAVYLLSTLAAVALLDGDQNSSAGPLVWLAGSVLLGAGTGRFAFVPLALLVIPIAVPFGLPENGPSHDPLPLWIFAPYLALYSAFVITLAVLARRGIDFLRHRHVSP